MSRRAEDKPYTSQMISKESIWISLQVLTDTNTRKHTDMCQSGEELQSDVPTVAPTGRNVNCTQVHLKLRAFSHEEESTDTWLKSWQLLSWQLFQVFSCTLTEELSIKFKQFDWTIWEKVDSLRL